MILKIVVTALFATSVVLFIGMLSGQATGNNTATLDCSERNTSIYKTSSNGIYVLREGCIK